LATPRLFRLKAEVAPAPSGPVAQHLPVAKVRVDTGVFHLDQLYDYEVSEKLSALAVPGVRVQLPFAGRETEGIIVERAIKAERAGELKSITKVLSPHPVATQESFRLIEEASKFYCCNPWDLIRSAIPPRVAAVDKEIASYFQHTGVRQEAVKPVFQSFAPFISAHSQLAEMALELASKGSVLVVAPDEQDVLRISNLLSKRHDNLLTLSSASSRDVRYRNFLKAMQMDKCIVVGTRSAVFAPVNNLKTIIVFKESSQDHFEIRSPGWNTSAIARMRSEIEKVSVVYTGFTPSTDVAHQIDQGLIKFNNRRTEVSIQAFTPIDGTLLPGKIFAEIKKALKKGPVLFLAPRKGYGNALLCAHCRNVGLCKCGGRLSVAQRNGIPSCVHCGTSYQSWRCTFCHRDKQYLAGRGVDRAAEEISRAFPGFPVIISAGEVIKESIEQKPSLVLSTPGAQPSVDGGYSAVVILDAIRFFSHTDLNGQERARELIFESSSLINSTGQVLLVIDESHPIVASVARWNIAPLLKRELAERVELDLPPTVSSAVLVMEIQTAAQIASGLRKAFSEGRLPSSCRIYGPTPIEREQAKIVVHVAKDQSDKLALTLHELQRRRSISKKDLLTIRINPYSL
jgi:primosomal protein N' (replication factor Y)